MPLVSKPSTPEYLVLDLILFLKFFITEKNKASKKSTLSIF